MPILSDHFYYFTVFGLVFLLLFLVATRWASGSWFCPLVLQAPYIGLGGCFIGLVLLEYSTLAVVAAAGFLSYLIGMILVWRFYYRRAVALPLMEYYEMYPLGNVNDKSFSRVGSLVFVIIGGVLFAFIPVFIRSGISIRDIGNLKYVIYSDGKIAFLAYMSLKTAMLYPLVIARTRRYFIISVLAYLVTILPIFLLGSKGAILGIIIDAVAVFYLRSLFAPINGGWFKVKVEHGFGGKYLWYSILVSLFVLPCAPLIIYFYGVTSSYNEAVVMAYSRTLGSFDSVFFAVDTGLSPGAAGFSLFDWWFAGPLKLIGHFNSPFNAVNQYIMVNYYGVGENLTGAFPTNFQVMEVVLSMSPFLAIPFLLVSGGALAFTIIWLCRNRFKSPIFALGFIILIESPYNMLLDGQSFIGQLFISIPVLVIIWLGLTLIGGESVSNERLNINRNRMKKAIGSKR